MPNTLTPLIISVLVDTSGSMMGTRIKSFCYVFKKAIYPTLQALLPPLGRMRIHVRILRFDVDFSVCSEWDMTIDECKDMERLLHIDRSRGTALYQCGIKAIQELSVKLGEELVGIPLRKTNPRSLPFFILSDGADTCSPGPAKGFLKTLIQKHTEQHGWHFTMIGLEFNAKQTAEDLGIDDWFSIDESGTLKKSSNVEELFQPAVAMTDDEHKQGVPQKSAAHVVPEYLRVHEERALLRKDKVPDMTLAVRLGHSTMMRTLVGDYCETVEVYNSVSTLVYVYVSTDLCFGPFDQKNERIPTWAKLNIDMIHRMLATADDVERSELESRVRAFAEGSMMIKPGTYNQLVAKNAKFVATFKLDAGTGTVMYHIPNKKVTPGGTLSLEDSDVYQIFESFRHSVLDDWKNIQM